jgi:hypothetical protein
MAKRLQVIVQDPEFRDIQRAAGVKRILSFDRGFDDLPGVTRLS